MNENITKYSNIPTQTKSEPGNSLSQIDPNNIEVNNNHNKHNKNGSDEENDMADLEIICDEVLNSEKNTSESQISKIMTNISKNNTKKGYEFIKNELNDVSLSDIELNIEDLNGEIEQTFIKENDDEKELKKSTKYLCSQIFVSKKQGKKDNLEKINQDYYFVHNFYDNFIQFCGVCDGHGPDGHFIAEFCSKMLPKILFKILIFNKPQKSLKKSFEILNKLLLNDYNEDNLSFDIKYSGTTISCFLLIKNKIYFANLGNSRCVLGFQSLNKMNISINQMTQDHDSTNVIEQKRILQSKYGKITEENGAKRILIDFNDLNLENEIKQKNYQTISSNVTRSIGDLIAHKYGGLISIPEITLHTIQNNDKFLLIGSDGIWTVFKNSDISNIIGLQYFEQNHDLQNVVNKLVEKANFIWQDENQGYVDDITAILVKISKIT